MPFSRFGLVGLFIVTLMLGINSPCFGAGGQITGMGTPEDPALIEDFEDFAWLSQSDFGAWSIHIKLMADIDLNPNLPGRRTYSQPITWGFQGNFDGNGHVFKHFTLIASEAGQASFFGWINGSETIVKNLGLEDVFIYSPEYDLIGGFCGMLDQGAIIQNCYVNGTITGQMGVGGICGWNAPDGKIINCFSHCALSGTMGTGGICGASNGIIENCYSQGKINGDDKAGGICGELNSHIRSCYSLSLVTGNTSVGNIVGILNEGGTVESCYYHFLNEPDNGIGQALSRKEMMSKESFEGFTFVDDNETGAWIFTGESCPILTWQVNNEYLNSPQPPYFDTTLTGCGEEDDPFQIKSVHDFNEFCENEQLRIGYYALKNDIDLSDEQYPHSPVVSPFKGQFDGNGHVIRNMTINTASIQEAGIGVFNLNMGQIRNLGIEHLSINSYIENNNIGGLCAINSGTLDNCYSTGEFFCMGNAYQESLGGLCGVNQNGLITKCYSWCDLISLNVGSNYTGGLCGKNENGTINESYAAGSLYIFSSFSGGLCGLNLNSTITNSYALGNIYSSDDWYAEYPVQIIGGFCGKNEQAVISKCYAQNDVYGGLMTYVHGGFCGENMGTISNCYHQGNVRAEEYVGGFCGSNLGLIRNSYCTGVENESPMGYSAYIGGFAGYSETNMLNCFWNLDFFHQTPESSYHGVLGKTTSELQNELTFTEAGWSFNSVPQGNQYGLWHMPYGIPSSAGGTGYPMLYYQRDIPGDLGGGYGVDMEDVALLNKGWEIIYSYEDLLDVAKFWLAGK